MLDRAQVLRIRLKWEGPLMWVSHLDRMRSMERALLRADFPLTYSKGFNPRPQMVFALPSSLGIRSESEYIDISLSEKGPAEHLLSRLEEQLPEGISLMGYRERDPENAKNLMGQVYEADYVFSNPGLSEKIEKLLVCPELIIEKMSKKRLKDEDIRPLILSSEVLDADRTRLRVLAGSRANLRPDTLLQALEKYLAYAEAQSVDVLREELWIKEREDGPLIRPMETND